MNGKARTFTLIETRDLIKQVLHNDFSGTKFQVTTSRRGWKVVVHYENGPKEFAVQDVCYRYEGTRGEDSTVIYDNSGTYVDRSFTQGYLERVVNVYCEYTKQWKPPIALEGRRHNHAYIPVAYRLHLPIMKLARHLDESELATLSQTIGDRIRDLNITIG